MWFSSLGRKVSSSWTSRMANARWCSANVRSFQNLSTALFGFRKQSAGFVIDVIKLGSLRDLYYQWSKAYGFSSSLSGIRNLPELV
jgi:hypothetical protein